jgi:hypothetical protein
VASDGELSDAPLILEEMELEAVGVSGGLLPEEIKGRKEGVVPRDALAFSPKPTGVPPLDG